MTNKEQIMIDGCNVSECLFYQSNFEEDYDVKIKHFCSNWHNSCESANNSNCYFKQLARKTQQLETICKALDIEYGYDEETGAIVGRCNKLIEKEKVLEKYKQSLDEKNKFLQDLGISASGEFKRIKFYIENLKNKYDEKVKECEELKKQLMQKSEVDMFFNTLMEGWSNDPCGICPHKAENEELKKQLETSEKWRIKAEGLNEKFELRNTCYRKALEEIEKVINNILNSCLGRNTVSCRPAHNVCGDLINILDIINKAKGENKNE